MYADTAIMEQNNFSIYGNSRLGCSYSSSAARFVNSRSKYPIGETLRDCSFDSIQSRIGAIFDQDLPKGVSGLLRKAPSLLITVDGNPTQLSRNIISIKQPNATEVTKEATAAISFKAQIENVQEELGLSITQLAQLFGVTRKSVYDWFDGSAPRANISNRLELISNLIKEKGTTLNLKRLKGVWLTAENGSSFIDVLSNEELDQNSRLAAVLAKLDELAPRLGNSAPKLGKTYLGNAHTSDIDRVASLG